MGQVKKINIRNKGHCFFDDMIGIKNSHSNLLKIDKKSHEDIGIYYISYITIKKFSDCENIHSVYPLYLIIHSATEYFKERTVKNNLIRQTNTEKFFLELYQKLKDLMIEKNCFMKKIMQKLQLIQKMIYL